MNRSRATTINPTTSTLAALLSGALLIAAACGGTDSAAGGAATTSPDTTGPPITSPEPTTETTEPTDTTATTVVETTTTIATVDDTWKDDAGASCAAIGAELGSQPGPEASGAEYFAFWRDLRDRLPWFGDLDLPDELRTAPTDLPLVASRADDELASAEAALAAGDDAGANAATNRYTSLLEHAAAVLTVAGAECGDRARASNASMHVPLPSTEQLTAGFDSLWVSQTRFGTVVRVDPDSGDVLATIDVGDRPIKAQAADGRLIVRRGDAYVAIDPATDTVVATLPKSDVGPAANLSWAADGAMWICDGQRVHRYDPADFAPTGTVIELGIDCGQVYATADLAIAWNYNQDEGESGISAAVFIDPATDQVLATTPLPADVSVPIVLDDAVYFPAQGGTMNVVVDRSTWAVAATPDYGRRIGGSEMNRDERSVYLIADGTDVLVVDAETFELTDTIEPLTILGPVNALAHTAGALWVAPGNSGMLQRFDTP